ncbi:hypothetical protein PROSTU_02207 [Providencia stuartii ATCC 25827]|uniref:Uncharacterized protein n=1 Tax=Providencia stuartii ATCC 25827 TaxID=471874 RepID=A0AA86YIN8_PROST|nr:hypothetical protein PROSTU_02207 [Providencia stuartii ATCC 25827]
MQYILQPILFFSVYHMMLLLIFACMYLVFKITDMKKILS